MHCLSWVMAEGCFLCSAMTGGCFLHLAMAARCLLHMVMAGQCLLHSVRAGEILHYYLFPLSLPVISSPLEMPLEIKALVGSTHFEGKMEYETDWMDMWEVGRLSG